MKELSDRIIIGFLVLAIIVSLVGTLVSLSKLGELKMGVTGMAVNTSTGTASLTIAAKTEVTNRNATIAFGTGYVNGSFDNCTLNTEGFQRGCVSFTNLSNGFLVENTGNYNISLNYSSDVNAASFIGGTNPDPRFQLKVTGNSAAAQGDDATLDTTASCNNAWNSTYTSYANVSTTSGWLCGNSTFYPLDAANDRDAGVVDVQITIPANALQGAKTATFTFSAMSSG